MKLKKMNSKSNKANLKVDSETKPDSVASLTMALKHFETAEANLVKLERLWKEIKNFIPDGIAFRSDSEYEEKSYLYKTILPHLPKIEGWRPSEVPMELNDIAESRFEANEIQEVSVLIRVDEAVYAPGTELQKYRILLNRKRRELTRNSMKDLVVLTDKDVSEIASQLLKGEKKGLLVYVSNESRASLEEHIGQIATLLGSSSEPNRWSDLLRHMSFAEPHDFNDIVNMDWPSIKKHLEQNLYDENEPIPSDVEDLSVLVSKKPQGSVPKGLRWKALSEEDFERLIFTLISDADGYENPQWLTATTAPDRGRDVSVNRIVKDSLGGVLRSRIIIQCKHWQSKSVSVAEVRTLQAQMKLWEPPRVDVHIIATTGRFTSDAVVLIERENQEDRALRVEMWPESHLEKLLASRPNLIADFKLR